MNSKKTENTKEKKILKSMFLRSHLVFIGFNMVKMEANGFTLTMAPAIDEIYKDDPEGKKEAYLRHQTFFNTHAVPFSFIAGLAYALEKQHKENPDFDPEVINSVKTSLMGPTAGMFDSLFFNGIRVSPVASVLVSARRATFWARFCSSCCMVSRNLSRSTTCSMQDTSTVLHSLTRFSNQG